MVYSAFGLWFGGLGSSVIATDYIGRGALGDGLKQQAWKREPEDALYDLFRHPLSRQAFLHIGAR